jgi:hypothetical protein
MPILLFHDLNVELGGMLVPKTAKCMYSKDVRISEKAVSNCEAFSDNVNVYVFILSKSIWRFLNIKY